MFGLRVLAFIFSSVGITVRGVCVAYTNGRQELIDPVYTVQCLIIVLFLREGAIVPLAYILDYLLFNALLGTQTLCLGRREVSWVNKPDHARTSHV